MNEINVRLSNEDIYRLDNRSVYHLFGVSRDPDADLPDACERVLRDHGLYVSAETADQLAADVVKLRDWLDRNNGGPMGEYSRSKRTRD